MTGPWLGLGHTFTGSNGEVLDLSAEGSSATVGAAMVALVNADVVGMGAPKYEVQRSAAPALAGTRYRGTRVLERPVEMTFLVLDDEDSVGFHALDSWLWDIIGDPSQPIVWRVTNPVDGSWRELTIRFEEDAGGGVSRDPLYDGWAIYQLRFTADDPYWYGAPEELTFLPEDSSPFFIAAPDPGSMFFISQAMTTADVEVPNDGDVAAWIQWTAMGEMNNLDLTLIADGMSDGSLGIPDVISGDVLVLDTDPRVATAYLDGVDITEQIVPWDPRPIPAGGTQRLVVSTVITGDGFLRATVRPRYRRAY